MRGGNLRTTCVAVAAVPEANSGFVIGSPTGVPAGAPPALGANLNAKSGAKTAENTEKTVKGEA